MASRKATNSPVTVRPVGMNRLIRYGLFATITVSIVNVLILLIGLAIVEYPSEFVGGLVGPLAIGPVIMNSVIAAIGATIVYRLLTRYSARPDRAFTVVAVVILVVSFAMFLTPDLSGAPQAVFVTLALMHIAAAGIIVGVFTESSKSAIPSEGGE